MAKNKSKNQCTIPFSVLHKLELSGFDDDKLDSIHNTVYCPGTKVAFHTRESFWDKQGIKGGASESGEGVRQTYYPSVKFNNEHGSVMLANGAFLMLAAIAVVACAVFWFLVPETKHHQVRSTTEFASSRRY
ncbi:flavin-dependent L-tryptophan oxidase RebO [Scytonema sp. HK-05]|nr:flavin-dependent L-tryptophan oxidase RebO [Scytonema sp. HK-05]